MRRKFNLQMFAEENPADKSAEQQPQRQLEIQQTDIDEKKYTDKDVDELINRKFAEWSKKKDKEVSEAQKLAEMNAQERAEYERDQLKKKLDELERKDTLAEMSKTARKMLSEDDINVSDDLLSLLVTTDAEETKQAVKAFSSLFKEAIKTAVADALKGSAPKTGTGNTVTREQILSIKDRTARQKAIHENIELFK